MITEIQELLDKGYKKYENNDIVVYWNPKVCIHAGMCVKNSPEVFQPEKRPWINLDAASAEKIANTINLCPSGALKCHLKGML